MTNWNAQDDDSITSCIEQDWRDALQVADHYKIPIKRQSFEQAYWHQVFVPYLEDLSSKGWMGNPDVSCNVHVKFGALRDFVDLHYGADTWLATGHYARLWRRNSPEMEELMEGLDDQDWLWSWGKASTPVHGTGGDNFDSDLPLLVAAVDETKDQSYFLSACTSIQLARVIFPLGDFCKSINGSESVGTPTVRELAQKWDLPVANKRDSVGICFIGKRKGGFRSFLRHYYDNGDSYGGADLVDIETGTVLGEVDTLTAQAATVGQGARVSGSAVKYFVVGRSEDQSTVWICPGTHHAALYADSIELASDLSWVIPRVPAPLQSYGEMRVQCRIRHLQPLVDATLRKKGEDSYDLHMDRPLRGITPGQRAVFYVNGVCLGGATMARAGPSYFDRHLSLPADLHPAGANDESIRQLV
jgi:tRNA-specific 2-thiouridylase